MQDQLAIVHDQGGCHMPIVLQVEPECETNLYLRLADLVRHWRGELGMCAGLTTPRDLLRFHIDRFFQQDDGSLGKFQHRITFAGTIDIPIWISDTQLQWTSYRMLAAFAHLGGPDSGHYQALLRLHHASRFAGEPVFWLHCDDCRSPRPCAAIPPNFEQGITSIWLCCCDCSDLFCLEDGHALRASVPDAHSSGDALLAMLAT